jgi:hypothetical protein
LYEFKDWLGTKCEQLLRFVIVFALLFGVGKVAGVLSHLAGIFPDGRPIFSTIRECLHEFGDKGVQTKFFIWSSFIVFTLVFCWNLGAFVSRKMSMRRKQNATGMDDDKSLVLGSRDGWRIALYAVSSIFAALYWFTEALNRDVGYIATLLAGVYLVASLAIFVLRNEKRILFVSKLFD